MNRRRLIIVLIPLIVIAAFLLGPIGLGQMARSRVIAKIERRTGRRVSVGEVRAGLSSIAFDNISLDSGDAKASPPITVSRITAHYRLLPLLTGHIEIDWLEIEQPKIDLVRGGDRDNVSTLIEKLRQPRESSGEGGRLHIEHIRVKNGTFAINDEKYGTAETRRWELDGEPTGHAEITVEDATLQLKAGPRASARRLKLSGKVYAFRPDGLPTVEVEGGVVKPLKELALSGIEGRIGPDSNDLDNALVDLHGSYGGSEKPLWNASGWFHPVTRRGEIKLRMKRFKLSQLESVLNQGLAKVMNARDAEVDARLDVSFTDPIVDVSAAFHLSGLTIGHPMLGPMPVADLGFDARAQAHVDLKEKTLKVNEAVIDFRKLHASITGEVANFNSAPRFSAAIKIAPLPCQAALDAIPSELTPMLQGFKLQGTFYTDLHAGVDFGDLDEPVDLGGHVGIEGCKVLDAPLDVSAKRLQETFEQTVETEPNKWLTFIAGPENPEWVPFTEISPYLINSIMTTEDSGFFKHHGFIPSEFRSALQQNLQKGYFRLGASSITMQMVKNVLLSREKTLSRKLQELFLTWYIEKSLPKERIMEIYFNVIEFGPGIYGIGRAVKHYFGKTPKELEPQEAAFFSSILPSPKRRYVQYCHASGLLDAKWQAYVNRILKRIHERGRITDEEFAHAIATPVKFDRAEATPEKECMAMVKRLTTPLPGAPAGDANQPPPSDAPAE